VNRWEAFTAVCAYLRTGLLGERPKEFHEVSWELLIEASSYHSVTPALAWCLKDQMAVPSDVRNYLDTILALNGRRNRTLLEGLARIVGALNAIGIEPVVLKGAARLIEASYPAPTLRFLGDLDVLIPAERSAGAVVALQSIGFRANVDDEPLPPSHHHLQMLHDRETGVAVELHTDVIGGAGAAVISTVWFYKGTKPFRFRDLQIRLPDATRSAGHNIAHNQILHWGYQRTRVELRQLLDLAMIRAASESAIDWAELDERFCRMELGEMLATYLNFAEVLLGQPAPRLRHAPRAGAITDFGHIIEPPPLQPWKQLATMMVGYIAARCRDPRGVLKLFDVTTWPHRSVRVANAFKQRPPSW
jgi:Uncharacterised nucleotidyltransferase